MADPEVLEWHWIRVSRLTFRNCGKGEGMQRRGRLPIFLRKKDANLMQKYG